MEFVYYNKENGRFSSYKPSQVIYDSGTAIKAAEMQFTFFGGNSILNKESTGLIFLSSVERSTCEPFTLYCPKEMQQNSYSESVFGYVEYPESQWEEPLTTCQLLFLKIITYTQTDKNRILWKI